MEAFNWAGVAVAVIGVISALLSGRAARTAAKYSSDASVANAKVAAETEAYNRARKMDIETIERQDQEIEEIRQNNRDLREKVRALMQDNERLRQDNVSLHQDNEALRRRVTRLEQQLGENSER